MLPRHAHHFLHVHVAARGEAGCARPRGWPRRSAPRPALAPSTRARRRQQRQPRRTNVPRWMNFPAFHGHALRGDVDAGFQHRHAAALIPQGSRRSEQHLTKRRRKIGDSPRLNVECSAVLPFPVRRVPARHVSGSLGSLFNESDKSIHDIHLRPLRSAAEMNNMNT